LPGREPELALLDAALAETARGAGGCLVLTGMAGIGKTSLLATAAAKVEALGLALAQGRATELDRVAPLTTLTNALRQTRPHPLDLAALADRGGGAFWYIDQISEVLEEYVAQRPLVVLLDDAQWADELSAMALRSLVPALASSPLRWLLARRAGPRDTPAQAVVDWLVETGAAQVEIEHPLPPGGPRPVRRPPRGVPDQTVLTLASRADGNPSCSGSRNRSPGTDRSS
jgi:hypothetical protein